MQNAIRVQNLSKKYRRFSLYNVSFTLPSGCIMGLVGKNGSGKGTTIRAIIGSLRMDGGKIEVLGSDVSDKDFCRKRDEIGIVFDELFMDQNYKAATVEKYMSTIYKNWDGIKFF